MKKTNQTTDRVAPLVFVDERPGVETTNQVPGKLVFIPVQESLLEYYQKLQDETTNAFDQAYTPIRTVTRLMSFYLSMTEKHIKLDPVLAGACFELIEFLDSIRSLSTEIEFYREGELEAKEYLNEKEVQNG